MAFDFQPIPLVKEGEGPTILSASFANRIIEATNALWKIQGTNGVTVTKSRHDVVIDVPSTGSGTGVCVAITPAFDYKSLKNWIVTRGSIDVIGQNFNDIYIESGYYIDIAGTTSPTNGSIRSRRNQSLLAGDTYRLDWEIAGNHRGGGTNDLRVLVTDLTNNATLFDQTYTHALYDPWTEYHYEFMAIGDIDISIEFMNADPTPTSEVGALLRGMRFRNISRSLEMIGDELRCEGSEDVPREIDGPVYDILVYRTNTDQAAATNALLDRWDAQAIFLVGAFGSLNTINLFNIVKLIEFQSKTVVDWPYTFTVNFNAAVPPLYYIGRIGNNVIAGTGDLATKIPDGYDATLGNGNWLATDLSGETIFCDGGSNNGKAWPIASYIQGGTTEQPDVVYDGVTSTHKTYEAWSVIPTTPGYLPSYFGQFATGYNRIAAIGFSDVGASSVMSHDRNSEMNHNGASVYTPPIISGSFSTAVTPRGLNATGICSVEGWDAFNNTVNRLEQDSSVLEASVPNTAFCITFSSGVDYYYWHPNPADVLGTTWYHYDYNVPPPSRAVLADWRLQAAPVMTPNIGFPASPLAGSFWTGDGAGCVCYSPVFTGWRTNGNGEFIAIGNNAVIDGGGATTWNGTRASDFQGIYAIGLDGNALSPFHVELTFTGLSPAGVADDFYNHPTILLIDSENRIWFTGPLATVNGTSVDAWQLYYVEGDGSGGGQIGAIGGGIIHAMKEFRPGEYIVGGEFTAYIDSNGNDNNSAFLVFIDETGEEIDLTW